MAASLTCGGCARPSAICQSAVKPTAKRVIAQSLTLWRALNLHENYPPSGSRRGGRCIWVRQLRQTRRKAAVAMGHLQVVNRPGRLHARHREAPTPAPTPTPSAGRRRTGPQRRYRWTGLRWRATCRSGTGFAIKPGVFYQDGFVGVNPRISTHCLQIINVQTLTASRFYATAPLLIKVRTTIKRPTKAMVMCVKTSPSGNGWCRQ